MLRNPSMTYIRLARIRNSKSELPQSPLVPKFIEISNWIESTQPQACSSDVSISDSLMVNTDTTLLQNSMVMTEIQDDDSMEWDVKCTQSFFDFNFIIKNFVTGLSRG